MSESFLDNLFEPPKLESGDRVVRAAAGLGMLGRKRGTVVSSGGWYAVVQWDGMPNPRREFIPDLTIDNS
jgi:hypothetical protein